MSFTPLSISGCALWLDAADSSSLTLSSGSVTQWNDKSGLGLNYSNTSGLKVPTYTATGFNGGYPSVVFSSSYLTRTNSGQSASLYTVFFAGERDNNTSYQYIIDFQTGRYVIGSDSGFGVYNGSAWTFISPNTAGSFVYSFVCTTGGGIFANGTQVATITTFNAIATNGAVGLGSRFSLDINHFAGKMSEFLIYRGVLSTAQRQQIEGYLAWKWGLQASLPVTHPYKNYAPAGPLSTSAQLLLVNTTNRQGLVVLPSTITNLGRIYTFKDKLGTFQQSTITFQTLLGTSDTFEDGSSSLTCSNTFGSYSFLASGTTWLTVGGARMNQAFISTAQSASLSTFTSYTSSLTLLSSVFKVTNTPSTQSMYLRNSFLYFGGSVLGGTKTAIPQFLPVTNSFSPRSLSNMRLWIDAQDPTAYILSGSNVTRVIDKSPSNVFFSNATGFFYRRAFNGSYPGFFSPAAGSPTVGTQHLGSNTGFAMTPPFTVFVVAQQTTAAANYGYIMDSAAGPRPYILNNTLGTVYGVLTGNPLLTPSLGTLGFVVGTGTSYTYPNGSNSAGITGNLTTFTTTDLLLGQRFSVTEAWPGYICELFIYNQNVSLTQRQQMEGYLAWKWGLVYKLPSTHPYKSFPP